MYADYILFAVAALLALLAVVLVFYLLRSRKKSREDLRILRETTQKVDLMTTMKQTAVRTKGGETTQLLTELLPESATELLVDGEGLASDCPPLDTGLELSCLQGKYILLQEIHGGGMSRIFKARHATLGNEWIVKYVDGRHAALANEEHVLKQLNHISLPQIIDVFHSDTGTFLVERYIEGYTLREIMDTNEHISQGLICDWAEQLAQVLGYLHRLEIPIIHCDLKPSNIMVTHDNKLVLIDFGISKRQGISEQAVGITYGYAAPEQFRGDLNDVGRATVKARFGTLPEAQLNWNTDERTDIYSLGVILYELAVGEIPLLERFAGIRQLVSPTLAELICKCLEIDPESRYQTTGELLSAIERVKETHLKIARSLTLRYVLAAVLAAAVLGSVTTGATGAFVNQRENLCVLSMDPNMVVVTEQQTTQLLIHKNIPGGAEKILRPDQIQWSYPAENVARIEGDCLVGLNQGNTTIYGKYRNKMIEVNVKVVAPAKELTDISLRYRGDASVAIFAGNGVREHTDGSFDSCSFVSPESIYQSTNGTILLSDSGKIRKLTGGQTETIDFDPPYITAAILRSHGDNIYFVTDPWQDSEGSTYGLVKMNAQGAEFLFSADAVFTTIRDFECASDGNIWMIQENIGTGQTTLNTINAETGEYKMTCAVPASTCDLAFDAQDNLYLAVSEEGSILRLNAGSNHLSYFAGVKGQRHWIDGAIMKFYQPMRLAIQENQLYVLDYDVIRCVTIEGDGAIFCETIAGIPSTDSNPGRTGGEGANIVFPASRLADLTVTADGTLLLTDPKHSILYSIDSKYNLATSNGFDVSDRHLGV